MEAFIFIAFIVGIGLFFFFRNRKKSNKKTHPAIRTPVDIPKNPSVVLDPPKQVQPTSVPAVPEPVEPEPLPRKDKGFIAQYGPNPVAWWSYENYYLDQMKSRDWPDDFIWRATVWDAENQRVIEKRSLELVEDGFVDPNTSDLLSWPTGFTEVQSMLLLPSLARFNKLKSNRQWKFTWTGDAQYYMGFYGDDVIEWKIIEQTPSSLTVFVPEGAQPNSIRFTRADNGIKDFSVHEVGVENANPDHVLHPRFIERCKKYDMIRTLDTQHANGMDIRDYNDVALPTDPVFSYKTILQGGSNIADNGRTSVPYEHLFEIYERTGKPLWIHFPILCGSPFKYADLGWNPDEILKQAENARDSVLDNLQPWIDFAREIIKRAIASGYKGKLLIELVNEVWNFALAFVYSSRYAMGIGQGDVRYGYGQLVGLMIHGLNTALKEFDTNNTIELVIPVAGQTVNPHTTLRAYQGIEDICERHGWNFEDHISNTGISLTGYHGGALGYYYIAGAINGLRDPKLDRKHPEHNQMIEQAKNWWRQELAAGNHKDLKLKLRDAYLNDPNMPIGRVQIMNWWAEHKTFADQFNVPLLGEYEGKSHDNAPPEFVSDIEGFSDFWQDYHFGPEGTAVVEGIMDSLIKTYPNIISAQFSGDGELDARYPWIDGPPEGSGLPKTEMQLMLQRRMQN